MVQLGFGYCLRCLVMRLLMDWSILSIPVYVAFLCRNTVMTALLNLAYGCLCCWINILAAAREGVLFIPFPAWLHGLRSLWQPGASPLWLILSALVSLAYILAFARLSVQALNAPKRKKNNGRSIKSRMKEGENHVRSTP